MAEPYVATGCFYSPNAGKVLLHLRSSDAPFNPDMWSLFGGYCEETDGGNPVTTWLREVREELGIKLERSLVMSLTGLEPIPGPSGPRHPFYYEWHDVRDDFRLTEGQALAWFGVDEALALHNLSDETKVFLGHMREHLLPAD